MVGNHGEIGDTLDNGDHRGELSRDSVGGRAAEGDVAGGGLEDVELGSKEELNLTNGRPDLDPLAVGGDVTHSPRNEVGVEEGVNLIEGLLVVGVGLELLKGEEVTILGGG